MVTLAARLSLTFKYIAVVKKHFLKGHFVCNEIVIDESQEMLFALQNLALYLLILTIQGRGQVGVKGR